MTSQTNSQFYQHYLQHNYTDIKLIIDDGDNKITDHFHKIVLASNSEYFHKLFMFGKEKDQTEIVLNVIDATISYDIIMTFYGQTIPENKMTNAVYILKMFRCRQFFCLPNDVSLLYGIIVPSSEFEYFLETVQEFDTINDIKLLTTIKKNIPPDYDVTKFAPKFAKKILVNIDYRIIVNGENYTFNIWDINMMKLVSANKDLRGRTDFSTDIDISNDGRWILTMDFENDANIINIISTETLEVVYSIDHEEMYNIHFSPDSKYFYGCDNEGIMVWHTETCQLFTKLAIDGILPTDSIVRFSPCMGKILLAESCTKNPIRLWSFPMMEPLNTINLNKRVQDAIFSPNGEMIAVLLFNKAEIILFDGTSWENISSLKSYHRKFFNIAFSPDCKCLLASTDNKSIAVWDLKTSTVIKYLRSHNEQITAMCFSADGKQMASCGYDGIIDVWDMVDYKLVQHFENNDGTDYYVRYFPQIESALDKKLKEYVQNYNDTEFG